MLSIARNAEVKIRTNDELKRQTRKVYERWGMSLSDAINLFMRKSVEVGGLPFDIRPEPRINLSGRDIIKADPATGVTILPSWMDAPEDDGLYDDLV